MGNKNPVEENLGADTKKRDFNTTPIKVSQKSMPRQSMGGTPVPHEKSFVFKMHLNPFKAILDQVF